MKIDTNMKQLKKDVAEHIISTRRYKNSDKRKSAFVAIYIGIVSAITTVCIGIVSFLPVSYEEIFGITALVSSASLTVVAAWDGIFGHKKLWISEAMTQHELFELRTDIRHGEASSKDISKGISKAQADAFYSRYKRIMRDANERWYKMRE